MNEMRPISKLDSILNTFKPKELNSSFWSSKKLNQNIRTKLLFGSKSFIDEYDVPYNAIKDVIFTGSLAGHLWHPGSDIDVHIIVDFDKIDCEPTMVRQLYDVLKINWAIEHEQTICGFPIEIYVQDSDEPFSAEGVYSLLFDRWLVFPVKTVYKTPDQNKIHAIISKTHVLIRKVEHLFKDGEYAKAYSLGDKIQRDLKRMRSIGLRTVGQTSAENTAYRVIRSNGEQKYLRKLVSSIYKKMTSLKISELTNGPQDLDLSDDEIAAVGRFVQLVKSQSNATAQRSDMS